MSDKGKPMERITMEGMIFDIKRFAVHDGPGIRTTVFFKGCPLVCKWCHNPEGLKKDVRLVFDRTHCIGKDECGVSECYGPDKLQEMAGTSVNNIIGRIIEHCPCAAARADGYMAKIDTVMSEIAKDEAFYNSTGGGVTFSGGEPLMQPEFLISLLQACREKGYHVAVETSLFSSEEIVERAAQWVDMFMVDLKLFAADSHVQNTGVDNARIHENLRYLCSHFSGEILVRVPLIPDLSDTADNLTKIADFLLSLERELPVELLPYNALAARKYKLMGLPPFLPSTAKGVSLHEARDIFLSRGIDCLVRNYKNIERQPVLGERNSVLRERAIRMDDNKPPFERPLFFTEAFRQADGKALIIKRALGFANVLRKCTLSIYPEQRLLGESLRTVAGSKGIAGEFAWMCYNRCPETGYSVDKRMPPDVVEALEYWKDKGLATRTERMYPEASSLARSEGLYDAAKNYFGHIVPYFQTALQKGFTGILEDAEMRLSEAKDDEQRDFYNAVIISCNAIIELGIRYKEMAVSSNMPELVAVMERVPAHPPQTFHEALQMVWLVHQVNEEEAPAVTTHSFGRFDQYLYPYYQDDIKMGRINRQEALELIEEFWIKCYRTYDEQHTTIGGILPDGSDGTNELSYLCLEAMRNVFLPRAVGARVHSGTPKKFLSELINTLELGMGVPSIFNDEVSVPAFSNRGIATRHAREYVPVGCIELAIPAHIEMLTPAGFLNSAKVLELALNRGRSLLTGQQVGPQTPAPQEMDFDRLIKAFKEQLAFAVEVACNDQQKAESQLMQDQPMPFYSCLIPTCMTEGTDALRRRGDSHYTGVCLSEVATTINSLAAIKDSCYVRNGISLERLVEALGNNFNGDAALRHRLLRTPKFGNDYEATDTLGCMLLETFSALLASQPHARDGWYVPLVFSRPHRQLEILGVKTAATADGRKAKTMLAISLNPVNGTALKGLTAIFNSQNRLPMHLLAGGASNNLDIDCSVLMADGREKMIEMLKAWILTGGLELSLQFSTKEMLLEAKKNPDKFPNLIVRVYGFSEFFSRLDSSLQDYVIARMENVDVNCTTT